MARFIADRERAPRTPAGLGDAGRRLWRSTLAVFENFDPHDLAVLGEMCLTADELGRINTEIAALDELTVVGSRNQPVEHPLLQSARSHRETLAKLGKALNLPAPRRKSSGGRRGRLADVRCVQPGGAGGAS